MKPAFAGFEFIREMAAALALKVPKSKASASSVEVLVTKPVDGFHISTYLSGSDVTLSTIKYWLGIVS